MTTYYSATVIALSPTVYWRVGESSGTNGVDEMGAQALTYVGSPTLGVAGAVQDADTAVTFAAAKYATHTGLDLTANDCTFMGWLNWPATTGVVQYLFGTKGTNGGLVLRLNTSSKLEVVCAGTATATSMTTAFPTGGYHHFAVTYVHNGVIKYYLDGALVNTTAAFAPAFVAGRLTGSLGSNNGSNNLIGTLDELAIWNGTALSATDIANLYEAGLTLAGVAAPTLPHLSTALIGLPSEAVLVAPTLPHLTTASLGSEKFHGAVAPSLPHLASASVGTVTVPPLRARAPDGYPFAWVTTLDYGFVGVLERSQASMIRGLAWSIERNKPGVASFEYHRDSSAVVDTPGLVAFDNLLWIAYRGVTRVYVLEQRTMQLDGQENTTGWYRVAGRGVLQLLGDRLVWPDGFTGTQQPDAWTDQWRTITGVSAGTMLWTLISETNSRFEAQIAEGTIQTTPGDEWTQKFRFDTILDVVDSVSAALGDVDMDGSGDVLTFHYYNDLGTDRSATVILEEGADVTKATRDTSKQANVSWIVAEGVGEGVFAKIATAEDLSATRRREAYLDAKDAGNLPLLQLTVAGALDELEGSTDRVGLDLIEDGTGSKWLGIDGRYQALRDFGVGDWVRAIVPDVDLDESVRVVALYFGERDDRIVASMDVNDQRTEYLLRLAEGNESSARSIGVQNRMPQGQLVPYSLGPWSGPFDTDVAAQFFFTFPSRIFLLLDVILKVRFRAFQSTSRNASGSTSGPSSTSTTASGGSSTPTSGSSSASTTADGGSDTRTSGSSSASTTDDGGGQTKTSSSGGSSTETSTTESAHRHLMFENLSSSAGGYTAREFGASDSGGIGPQRVDIDADTTTDLYTRGTAGSHSHDVSIPGHTHSVTVDDHHHGMAHTHSVTIADHHHGMAHTHTVTIPAHSHGMDHTHTVPPLDLNYGMFEEALPASWSVTPKLYSVSPGGSLTLVHTFSAITDAVQELDLTAYADTSGDWMVELKSDAAQPQNGRLVADVYGAATGAISSAR